MGLPADKIIHHQLLQHRFIELDLVNKLLDQRLQFADEVDVVDQIIAHVTSISGRVWNYHDLAVEPAQVGGSDLPVVANMALFAVHRRFLVTGFFHDLDASAGTQPGGTGGDHRLGSR